MSNLLPIEVKFENSTNEDYVKKQQKTRLLKDIQKKYPKIVCYVAED